MTKQRETRRRRRVALYLCASASSLSAEDQRSGLGQAARRRGWDVVATFQDRREFGKLSREKRPGLDQLFQAAARGTFDTVAVSALDRFARSAKMLAGVTGKLDRLGIALYVHKQQLDTAEPEGRPLFAMVELFADFENGVIKERVGRGLKLAKAAKVKLGRPRKIESLTVAQRNELSDLIARGMGTVRIGKIVGLGRDTVRQFKAGSGYKGR